MIRSFLYRILERRHFWRRATFSEVADLYISRSLRLAAINIGAGFTSIYLYKSGYSIVFIMALWAAVQFGKTLITPLAGIFLARIGTARGTLISNILYIPAMLAIGFMPELGMTAIIIFAIFMAVSGTIYEICYLVDFSIVKNPQHAGKEIGFMNIVEKLTITISPVLGGFIALLFGAQVIMWLASILFAFSTIPLLIINKKAEKRQRLTIHGFPWHMAASSILAKSAVGFDIITTSVAWGLFVAIFIFPNSGNDIYVIIGVLSSITIIVAMVASIMYGKIIDKNRGGNLLKIGVISNSLVHLSRIFATTPFDSVGVNVLNETATTAQNMAFLRGIFDIADVSGHRVMYLVCIVAMNSFGAMLACIAMIICEVCFGGIGAFRIFFAISALVILGVGTARFPLYRR
jgi:hypothetical protein